MVMVSIRRLSPLLLLAILCLTSFSFSFGRRLPFHKHGSPDLDGLKLTQSSAEWFSVCRTSQPGVPKYPPAPSPLPPPVIDDATQAVTIGIVTGRDPTCIAWGFHSDDIETVGWSYLSIETNADESDYLQSRAAGVLEGYLSQVRISQYVPTLMPGFYPNGLTDAVKQFLNQTINFNTAMVQQVGGVDPYWTQVGCLYIQLAGMLEGYSLRNPNESDVLSWFDLYSLQLDVDIGDITTAVGLNSPLATQAERKRAQDKVNAKVTPKKHVAPSETHCSALVKLTPNNADIFIGHDTWAGFKTMLRTFKLHHMPLRCSTVTTIHQSSYPGFLFSSDDWYQLSGPNVLMTVTETSNDIYADALYSAIQSGSVGIWARTIIANRMATDGPSWSSIFSQYNSGTCDNQWIILNHRLFVSGATSLTPGLLTIAEQTPGFVVTKDVTSTFEQQGYWSSFNIPAFTYAVSGYDRCQGGEYVCSYYKNFRYLLFDELHASVTDLATMQAVLSYNDWQHDPLQHNSSAYAIAARYDLQQENPSNYGGIDVKVTSDSWMKSGELRVSAYSGPTKVNQPPFEWQNAQIQPKGQPKTFDFPFIQYATNNSTNAKQRRHTIANE